MKKLTLLFLFHMIAHAQNQYVCNFYYGDSTKLIFLFTDTPRNEVYGPEEDVIGPFQIRIGQTDDLIMIGITSKSLSRTLSLQSDPIEKFELKELLAAYNFSKKEVAKDICRGRHEIYPFPLTTRNLLEFECYTR